MDRKTATDVRETVLDGPEKKTFFPKVFNRIRCLFSCLRGKERIQRMESSNTGVVTTDIISVEFQ